jgi:hypothetical protein
METLTNVTIPKRNDETHKGDYGKRLVGCVATVIKPLPLKRHARAANMIAPPKFALPHTSY